MKKILFNLIAILSLVFTGSVQAVICTGTTGQLSLIDFQNLTSISVSPSPPSSSSCASAIEVDLTLTWNITTTLTNNGPTTELFQFDSIVGIIFPDLPSINSPFNPLFTLELATTSTQPGGFATLASGQSLTLGGTTQTNSFLISNNPTTSSFFNTMNLGIVSVDTNFISTFNGGAGNIGVTQYLTLAGTNTAPNTNATTNGFFQIDITASSDIPNPAPLLLMGVGLMGLGFTRRF